MWQAESRAQLFFASGHLSIVALVIVAAQMQDAVQNENFDLLRGRVPEQACILRCDLDGNGNIAGELLLRSGPGWK